MASDRAASGNWIGCSIGELIDVRDGYILHLEQGDRLWMNDDGFIDETDIQQGAIVSNMPAGSIYTTVLEHQTNGHLWLPKAGPAKDVLFTFRDGRIVDIQASSGSIQLMEELDRHSGEPRRMSHIGLGLNPYLKRPTGWPMMDEHVRWNSNSKRIYTSLTGNQHRLISSVKQSST